MGDHRTPSRALFGALLLGLTACAGLRLERVEPPQLGLGLEPGEPAEDARRAELRSELRPEAVEAPQVVQPANASLADGGTVLGAEPVPASQSARQPELLRGCEIVEGVLADPAGNVLARVSDLLVDPLAGRVSGVFASSEAVGTGDGPFVAREGFSSWETSRILLSHAAAEALALELREFETAELFRQRELETFEGVIASGPEVVEGERLASITLVDDNNHRRRIVLAPPDMLATAPLVRGARVRILGLSMRDEAGPFEVAARLTVGDFDLPLRDHQGRTTWDTRAEPPRGWRFLELRGREAHVGDARVGSLTEIEVRAGDGSVASVLIESGDRLVRLPWGCLRRGGGSWFELSSSDWQAGTGKGARDAAENDDAPR